MRHFRSDPFELSQNKLFASVVGVSVDARRQFEEHTLDSVRRSYRTH
ncbi:MAG: hypothetical protein GXP29_06845 [Planctomycetes bacterium]|nr:hypothetical protein [Planctomycetota bacterium]